jgi:DedD protein
MAKQQTEDELNLKRKARRRLIGAVVLTLAVVVILPMVLDNEPKPSGKDIDLSIPAPDKAGEFVTHRPVSEVAVTLPSEASSVMASPAPVVAASAIDTPALAPQADKPSVAPSSPQQAAPSKAKTSPESSPHKSAESQKSAEPPQSTQIHKSAEAGSADQGSAESYVAQVGAYSKPDTAKQELNKLKKWGFKAYIEKAGDKTRVRVGPYVDRAKAEKAAHQLEKHGLHPVIISK